MKKLFFLLCFSLLFSLCSHAYYRLGDYMEIDGVQAFVFYVDQSGEHGLVMSMPALTPKKVKKIDKIVKDGLLTEAQADVISKSYVLDIGSYDDAGMLKTKSKRALFTDLIKSLSDNGEQNAIAITNYCKEKNISMKDNFPWEYWASQLGNGWFMPGDAELSLYAQFYCGGLGRKNGLGIKFVTKGRAKELSGDERVQNALQTIAAFGIMSSTAKHPECGFRALCHVFAALGKTTEWFEILDEITGGCKEKSVSTCAVHKF